MTKTPIPTENSKIKGQHTQTPPKTSITQQLRTDLGRSVGETSNPTGVVYRFYRAHLPTHRNSRVIEGKDMEILHYSGIKFV